MKKLYFSTVEPTMVTWYRFTNLRVTVISGLTGQDRSDFSYKVIKDVQVVPRFIGEWGDVIVTLKDGTKVDLRSVPKFREIAKYCQSMAEKNVALKESDPKVDISDGNNFHVLLIGRKSNWRDNINIRNEASRKLGQIDANHACMKSIKAGRRPEHGPPGVIQTESDQLGWDTMGLSWLYGPLNCGILNS
ncbi:unnamed protein product [Ilex paraguariensis]|uniref:YdbS-like PH domain-containing protein n=1 Tax=Ilex paraguariensis TaxID=185542 RepID=A0ABC8TSS7_9AQUA